jgi:hypothetical protein
VAAVALLCIASGAGGAHAQAVGGVDIRVVDAGSGRPVDGAVVTIVDEPAMLVSLLRDGVTHRVTGLSSGLHTIAAAASGYRPERGQFLVSGQGTVVTVRLRRTDEATDLPTVGRVEARIGDNPASGPVLHTTLGAHDLERSGAFRLADALVTLPDLSATNQTAGRNQTSQSNGPGSSIYMDIRGFGPIETLTLIDGHPIGQGVDLGFNFQDAPIFALRDVYVGYGSGASGISSLGEIGGIVDMRTLEPTAEQRMSALQGFGSYGRALTELQATGITKGHRIGYALAYGVEGTGGPIAPQLVYSPSASFDQSSSDPAIRNAATYPYSQETTRRSALAKLRLSLGPATNLTLRAITNTSWEDGTGNSDNIYRDPQVALALGQELLAAKPPPPADTCAAGTFTATNIFGQPNGFGRNGQPDGGVTCQTPQQYAQFNTGFQGIGPHQTQLRATDYDLRLTSEYGRQSLFVDAFTNSYYFNYDRSGFIPYFQTPGDTGFTLDQLVVNTGVQLVDRISGSNNDFALGIRDLSNANRFRLTQAPVQAPHVNEQAFALEDRFHPNDKLTAQLDLALEQSTATSGASLEPHVALSYDLTPADRMRVSAGGNVVQPPGIWLGLPFVPTPLNQFVPTCSGVAPVGTGPTLPLGPERGGDQELTFSHLWGVDSQVTLAAYNAQLVGKLYNVIVPISSLPAGSVPASALVPYQQILMAVCGPTLPPLGVTENLNLGDVSARGLQALANVRLSRALVARLDWSEESAVLRSASADLLAANLSLVPGGQLPAVPLHKAALGLDYRSRSGFEAGFTTFRVSTNNPANLPAYTYTNAEVGALVGPGRLRFLAYNLFDQQAGDRSLIGEGVPLALNAFAPPFAYAPFVGAAATTRYVLAPRRYELYYTFSRPRRQ